ncbi:MAG: carboxy terminal-processing peptidase [Acidobacteriota bacterium]|nr:carboxy terminal-processing peptidase [Acidobacteriota bacterium]
MANKLKVLALLLFTLVSSGFVFQDERSEKQQDPYDALAERYQPEIASLVSKYLNYYHYQRYKPDDKVSKNLFNAYLKNLDFNRMYFLESDIESFRMFETRLDNDLNKIPANLEAAFIIFDVFRQRVNERLAYVRKIMKTEFDFTKDEYTSFDRTEAPWAKTRAELDELWRQRVKEDILRFKLREKKPEEYMETLTKRYDRLQRTYDEYEVPDIVENFLSSLAEVYDPHSSYLRPATKDNFDIQMGHSLEGIGATLTTEGDYTLVVDIVKGGPAHRQGELQKDDKIIAVSQGAEGKPSDVVGLRIDKVVKQIRGPKGSVVRLTVIPADAADQSVTKEIVITRDRVELTSQDAKAEVKEIEGKNGLTYRVGVINIPSFYMDSRGKIRGDENYKSTTRDVRKLLDDLEEKQVDGVVIDLRRNGGGSLDEAIRLTGLFIHEGPIVQIKNYRDKVDVERDPDPEMVYGGPLMVLTSVFSASASEIFASALQDYGRAVVVGGKSTHGKGTVQNVISLQSQLNRTAQRAFEEDVAGALKLTTHKFYRVNGGSTQFKGVEPDIILPSPYDGMKVTEEHLDFALGWDEIESVNHRNYKMVRQSLNHLRKESTKRVTKTREFEYLREDLAYRERRRKENRVSLNLEKRLQEKKALEDLDKKRNEERKLRVSSITTVYPKPDPEELKKAEEAKADKDKRVPVPDAILEECLMVMADYLKHEGYVVAASTPEKKPL